MPPRAQHSSQDAVQASIFCLDVLCKLLLCHWHPWVASFAASGMHLAAALCTLPRPFSGMGFDINFVDYSDLFLAFMQPLQVQMSLYWLSITVQ
eukprot:3941403-Rhodomonas_salina.1